MQGSSKIIVLGGRNAGKTALVMRCLTGQFFHNHSSASSDTSYHFELNGNVMDIVDSKGRNDALISFADGILLVYSITDRASFTHLNTLMAKVKRLNLKKTTKVIVVGTKNDKQKQREVSLYEGQEFSMDHNCQFFETSAYIPKQNDIQDIFQLLLLKRNTKRSPDIVTRNNNNNNNNNKSTNNISSNNTGYKRRQRTMSESIKLQPHKIYDTVRNFVQKRRRESTGQMFMYGRTDMSRSMIQL